MTSLTLHENCELTVSKPSNALTIVVCGPAEVNEWVPEMTPVALLIMNPSGRSTASQINVSPSGSGPAMAPTSRVIETPSSWVRLGNENETV